jgi:hypothetical protein
MNADSWETSSSDVKQSIISRADPETARRLCQTDRKSRETCRDRLPADVKFRFCLDSSTSAKECDLIPMFSRQQFLRLIPPQIEIFADEPLQLRHEFYSQNYKLPDEGFSEALRKAKVINTICVLIRPHILIEYGNQMGDLPPYIDATKLDEAVAFYKHGMEKYKANSRIKKFSIIITGKSTKDPHIVASMENIINIVTLNSELQAIVNYDSPGDSKFLMTITDAFITDRLKLEVDYDRHSTLGGYKRLDGGRPLPTPNAFIFSRILYDLLNKSIDIWEVEYVFSYDYTLLLDI